MTIWFTSDQHFGHHNILKYCPNRQYDDIFAMNNDYVNRYNERVENGDTVYMLGDFSLKLHFAEIYGPKLKGNKVLVPGNHDRCHPLHSNTQTYKRYSDVGFFMEELQTSVKLNANTPDEIDVNLCHFPYKFEHPTDVRYSELRPTDDGKVLLHGHVHQSWKVKYSDNGTLMINVGVDVWDGNPVSEQEILELIRESGK